MSLVTAETLSVRIGTKSILTNINFSIRAGEIVTIVGPNGSGKSTFLRSVLGIIAPSSGRVQHKAGIRIGYVPQKLALDPSLPLRVTDFLNLPKSRRKEQINDMLENVGLPSVAGQQVSDLSGGQLQRVLLARALLGAPELLVLDEPTQGLDQRGESSFYALIEEVRQETGAAVLMVSHDLHVVMSSSDRVICLNGHICCEGKPHVVRDAPEYRALFGLGTQGQLALYQHGRAHNDCEHDGGHHG